MPQFPYATTLLGLTSTIQQLRSVFPPKVTADTLKKWNIAANNEGSILQTLRFIGVVDEEGTKQVEAGKIFVLDDEAFATGFAELVKRGYAPLFELYGDAAWKLDKNKLTSFFRTSDETSARVGEQQASTFAALASFAGQAPAATSAADSGNGNGSNQRTRAHRGGERPKQTSGSTRITTELQPALSAVPSVPALSVRIEINLPVSDKQEVYDNIFRSIRENLLTVNADNE